MLQFTGERIVPEATNCEPKFADKMRQEHICRYYFASQLVKNKKILDIGCGVGYGSKILSEAGAKSVVAFDIADDAIEHAMKYYNASNIYYHSASATTFDFGEKVFDIATCFELIEHVEDQHAVLRRIARSLKPEGILFISTPRPLDSLRAPFHIHELAFEEFNKILKGYFEHLYFYYENNHFTSLITDKEPSELTSLHYMHNQFNLGQADYFMGIASSKPFEKLALEPTAVFNNDAYIKLLEHDIEILHQAETQSQEKITWLQQKALDGYFFQQCPVCGKNISLNKLDKDGLSMDTAVDELYRCEICSSIVHKKNFYARVLTYSQPGCSKKNFDWNDEEKEEQRNAIIGCDQILKLVVEYQDAGITAVSLKGGQEILAVAAGKYYQQIFVEDGESTYLDALNTLVPWQGARSTELQEIAPNTVDLVIAWHTFNYDIHLHYTWRTIHDILCEKGLLFLQVPYFTPQYLASSICLFLNEQTLRTVCEQYDFKIIVTQYDEVNHFMTCLMQKN